MKNNKSERKVVVTGLGIISPCGIGNNEFINAIKQGQSGIKSISKYFDLYLPCQIAGMVLDFNPIDYIEKRNMPRGRSVQFAIAASKIAYDDAGLKSSNINNDRFSVIIGTSVSGLGYFEEELHKFRIKGSMNPYTCVGIFAGGSSSEISIRLGAKGYSNTISNGCTSGTDAIGNAFQLIKNNMADIVICGGAEAPLTPSMLSGFSSLRVLSLQNNNPEKACRPFDAKRDGMVLSEGAGMLILEDFEHAMKRDAKVYAEIIGYSANNDAFHMTQPSLDGCSAAKCMQLAIDNANIKPHNIQCINAHGTSTKINDKTETKAIKNVFGGNAFQIPIYAIKSMTGHSIGASGAIETIAGILALNDGFIPPTINHEFFDPDCDLDYVPNKYRQKKVNILMKNSFGFGGKNSCLIISK